MRFGLLVLLGFLWSARLSAIKAAAISGIPVQVTVSVSVLGIAFAFSGVATVRRSWPPTDKHAMIFYGLSGVLGFILPFLLENIVAPNLPVFLFVVIISTMPVMTILLAMVLGLERPKSTQVVAIGLGFLTALLIAVDTRGAGQEVALHPVWVLAGFAVPLIYAINTLFVAARWPRSADALHVAQAQSAIIGIAAAGGGIATGGIADWPVAAQNLPAILSIIGCEAVALLVYLKITRDHGASFVAQANYISMVFAAFLGFVLFGDRVTWLSAAAGVLLVVALHMARRKPVETGPRN